MATLKKCVNRLVSILDTKSHRIICKRRFSLQGNDCNELLRRHHITVADSVMIKRETYLSIHLDRSLNGAAIMASPISQFDKTVTKNTFNSIKTVPIDIHEGVTDEIANEIAKFLKFDGPLRKKCVEEVKKLWQLFLKDAVQLEINPLAETEDGQIVAVNSCIEFDNNARYRQKDIFDLEDVTKIEKRVKDAADFNLIYINMDGSIGCMSNGAGVGMATIDLVALNGGKPANFFDLGGGIGPTEVSGALKILESDPKVKSIFVNVFAGIVNCVTVAKGIIEACKENLPKHPIVIRLEGTNSAPARKILEESGLPLHIINDPDEAAKVAVKLAG